MRNFQIHGPLEERCHCGLELSSGEELEAWAVGPVSDDLFTGLS